MDENTVSQEGFPTLEDQDGQQLLFNLQELAVNNTHSIEQLQKDLKTTQEMITDAFKSDARYKEEDERVKDQSKSLRQIKASINERPEMQSLLLKSKDLKRELKDKKTAVSDYALEVMKRTGSTEFEKDGEVFEIKTVAKLVKRRQ
jgi:predicted RNase H-like nuclease (RuvC/YqgF family)